MKNSIFTHDEKTGIIKACSPDILDSSKQGSGIIIELSDTYIKSLPNDMELGHNVRMMLIELLNFKKSNEIKKR